MPSAPISKLLWMYGFTDSLLFLGLIGVLLMYFILDLAIDPFSLSVVHSLIPYFMTVNWGMCIDFSMYRLHHFLFILWVVALLSLGIVLLILIYQCTALLIDWLLDVLMQCFIGVLISLMWWIDYSFCDVRFFNEFIYCFVNVWIHLFFDWMLCWFIDSLFFGIGVCCFFVVFSTTSTVIYWPLRIWSIYLFIDWLTRCVIDR